MNMPFLGTFNKVGLFLVFFFPLLAHMRLKKCLTKLQNKCKHCHKHECQRLIIPDYAVSFLIAYTPSRRTIQNLRGTTANTPSGVSSNYWRKRCHPSPTIPDNKSCNKTFERISAGVSRSPNSSMWNAMSYWQTGDCLLPNRFYVIVE